MEEIELKREDFKKLLEEKLVKESVFITGNNSHVLTELFRDNYKVSPKIDESECLILSRLYFDRGVFEGIHIFALVKKNKSLQESLCHEDMWYMPEDIYEMLAFVMVEEKISKPGKRNLYLTRHVAVKDEEGKIIMIDKILDMMFGDDREIEIKMKKGFI